MLSGFCRLAWAFELVHQGGSHITIGSGCEVDGVSFSPDGQPTGAEELLKDDVMLLTGEGDQLIKDDGRTWPSHMLGQTPRHNHRH